MSVAYLKTQPLTAALFWFIENVNDETPNRNDMFFHLRERVRDESQDAVIIQGNPADGFGCVGPFATREDAIAYGDTVDSDWWVLDLASPDES